MRYIVPMLCLVLLSATSSVFAVNYKGQIIGPTGGEWTMANAVSDTGVVAGSFMDYSIDPGRYAHASMWSPTAGTIDLGRGDAWGINNSGCAVGVSNQRATLWAPGLPAADLGTFGGSSYALSINDLNVVVGYSYTTYWHAFRWDPVGGFQALEDSGNNSSMARAVNLSGIVAGYAAAGGTGAGNPEACVWDSDGHIRKIGTLGGEWSEAYSINNLGQVVGVSETADHGLGSFLWDEEHGMQDLGLEGATDINDLGQIIGWGNSGPYVWQDGVTTYLEAPEGFRAKRAHSINNAGLIVGICRSSSGSAQAVLWEPVPEPASLASLAMGFAILGLRRKRQ